MLQDKLSYFTTIILISLLNQGLCWTFYEKGYQGNKDEVCDHESKNKYCKNLGEHAYRGQLVDGVPKPREYFLNDAELFEELKFRMDNDILQESNDMVSDDGYED